MTIAQIIVEENLFRKRYQCWVVEEFDQYMESFRQIRDAHQGRKRN